jgi:hypothetical protein
VSVRADCFVTVGQWTSGVGFRAWAWGLGGQVVPLGATFVDCGVFLYISIPAVTAAGGFALTASPFFKRQKGTKRLCPDVRPLAGARCSFVPAFIWGASPPVCFATTSSRCVRLRRTALRACPPDERLHSACRRGGQIKSQIKIKSCRRATARPVEW